MYSGKLKVSLLFLMLSCCFYSASGQGNVPAGIHYQAVARDNYGKELVNEKIDVRFSIISGSPAGMAEYMEVHSNVITSKFGVFSLVIGKGINSGGAFSEFSRIEWSKALHFLKVEVKFENDFIDMGTMQFLAVPYALYAQKSLEPGPPGPKGDTGPQGAPGAPGDPATDNQTLSFDGSNISISGGNKLNLSELLQNLTVSYQPDGTYLGISRGNSVKLANIESDGDSKNEIQDITISSDKLKITNNPEAREWDLSGYRDNTDNQNLLWDPVNRKLGISGSTGLADLSDLKDDADANPANEMQDLTWSASGRILGISGRAASINLSELKDDADADPANEIQDLTWDPAKMEIKISGDDPVSLSALKDDADADPTNELQTLSYGETATVKSILISKGNSIDIGKRVAFRAIKINSTTGLSYMTDYTFIPGTVDFSDDNIYDPMSGEFTAPVDGIYTFNVGFNATGTGESRSVKIEFGDKYEILDNRIGSGTSLFRSITIKLVKGEKARVTINTGTSNESGTGSFSGFRVY